MSKPLQVEVVSRLRRLPLSAARCRNLLQRAASVVPPDRAVQPRSPCTHSPTLTILFAGDARMRVLNARYRGVNGTTDVLSFPADCREIHADVPERWHLGDVVVSIPTARRQALRRGHGAAREVEMLLLHGYLHLLGYDHERDGGEMERAEHRLRRALGLVRPSGGS